MLIALTGEGPTDYGKRDYKTREWVEGSVQQYMRKIAEEAGKDSIEFEILEKMQVKNIKVQQRNLKGLDGQAIPARRFAVWMQENKLKKGVFYCDADRENGSKNDAKAAQKRFEDVYQQVKLGLEGTDAIPAVPLRMIECWILGDLQAIETALQIKLVDKKRLKNPEYLWGDKYDPNSDYPKNYLKRLVRLSDHRYSDFEGNQEDFVEISQHADISTMREKCPISFEWFYSDFKEMICKNDDNTLDTVVDSK